MQKKLVICLLAGVLLAGNITAAVFAKYETTIDLSSSVSAKTFIMNTLNNVNQGTTNYNETEKNNDLKLGPGEYFTKYFSVQNWGNGLISESSFGAQISFKFGTNIPPIYCNIYKVTNTGDNLFLTFDSETVYSDFDSEQGIYCSTVYETPTFYANEPKTLKYKIVVGWNDSLSSDDYKYADNSIYKSFYDINVTSTQVNPASWSNDYERVANVYWN